MAATDLNRINRVAFFFSMVLAHVDLCTEEEPVGDDHPLFQFQGSGASDILTLGEVRAFIEATKRLCADQARRSKAVPEWY